MIASLGGSLCSSPRVLLLLIFGATPFYCFEFYMGCQSVLLPMPSIVPMGRLWVEQAQVCHVPWISHVFVGLRVLQPVCTSSYDLRDAALVELSVDYCERFRSSTDASG